MQAKRILLPILIAWLVVGCSMPSFGTKPSQPSDPAALEARGDYEGAANLLVQKAAGRPAPEQQTLQLRAAENFVRAQQPEAALALLEKTSTAGLPALDFHRRVVLAEAYNARSNPTAAMQILPQQSPPGASPELSRRFHQARAESYRISGKLLESVGELTELDAILDDPDQRLDNQKHILQLLMPLAESTLELLQPKPPGVLGGWMELVRLMKANAGQPSRLQAQVVQWRKRFPSHPALPNLIDSYYGRATASAATATAAAPGGARIAVLLPESGALAKAGDALRDGIMAAWAQQPADSRPQLMFYDSGPFEEMAPLYQQAVKDGARLVVGPLGKDKVSQFLGAGSLPVPTLALNQVDANQPIPPNLFQFGLSPEDEARQVADGAWADGLRAALVLSPDNDWGARIYNAFSQRWRELGGTVAGHQRYAPEGHDFATPVRALMNSEAGAARFVFMIAKAAQARQIRPQLQYADAAGTPIYATSAIYAGDPNAQRDQDLNGVRFPEIPWLLQSDSQDPLSRSQVAAALPESRGDYGRLYAMGMDAFTLALNLQRLGDRRGETIAGRTGLLYLGAQNQIERRMEWAQIENGLPRALGDSRAPSEAPGAARTPIPTGPAPVAPAAPPLRPVR